jgi:putative ABC transport system ATP-binding protein
MIELRDLVKTYPSLAGPVTALKGVSLDARAGEMIVVTGKSGSGKTTLVNMIAGLDRNSGGEVWVAGAALHQMSMDRIARWRGKTVGVVFQTFELLPSLTLVQNITLAMDFAGRGSIREQREKALHLLEQVDIAGHAHKLPSEISGGQQQRVAIARALANDPPVLVADEPTGSLDSATAEAVLEIFWNLAQSGRTVVLVTHDRDIARQAQRSIELFDGEIIARSSPSWNLEDDDVGFSLA